jgi:CubicO group peptidase (beta-lactamase class C family)
MPPRSHRTLRLAAALLCLTSLPAFAQAPPLAGLDAYVEQGLKDWEVPGLALAIIRNDSVIYARGYGVRELGASGEVDEHTLFAIASTTKAMTVAALGMLLDERKLRWDDPVSRHMPQFQLSDPFISRELTVRDLLTHRSGLARNDNLWIAAPFDRQEVLRRARLLPVTSSFRSSYGYSNIMYIAAGEVVAAVSGMSWDDFLERRLLGPLSMTRTTTRAAVVETRGNVASSHTRVEGRVQPVQRRNYDNIGGAGAVFSSVHDMAQWVRMHLNGGTYNGVRLLSPAALREMYTPQTVMRSDTTAERMFPHTHFRTYGLGWFLQDYHGHKMVHHSGSLNWTRTHVMMIPERRIGVVAIANYGSSNLQLALAYRIIDALLGLPRTDWSAEYLALSRRGQSTASAAPNQARTPNTTPSLAPADYVGTFSNELYGDIRLALENGGLVLRYAPDYTADLEHWHHDTFRARFRRPGLGSALMTFTLNHQGRVASFELEGFGEFRRVTTP